MDHPEIPELAGTFPVVPGGKDVTAEMAPALERICAKVAKQPRMSVRLPAIRRK